MTELARREESAPATVDSAPSALYLWARDAQDAYVIAQKLAATPFVSDTLRGKAAEITGAILTGHEIGMQPMASVRSIDIIGGVPAMRALALRGLVQSRGHEVWVESSSDTRAVVCGRRAGTEHVQRSTWTMDRARRLGLRVDDQRGPWRRQPEAMLVARATAEVCRLVAADVLLGLPYAAEEVETDSAATDAPVTTRVARRSDASRRTASAPASEETTVALPPQPPEPELDEPEVVEPESETVEPEPQEPPAPPRPVSKAQLMMLHALLGRAGLDERADRLDYVSTTLGRPVESSSDLTAAEASRVIDALTASLPSDESETE